MPLKLVTAPTTEPVTLAEAKDHLQVGNTTSFDAYITRLITVGRAWAEFYCRRWFEPQTWDIYTDGFYVKRLSSRDFPQAISWLVYAGDYSGFAGPGMFPCGPANQWRRIDVPMAGVTSVDLLKYKDASGIWQTLVAGTDYTVDLVNEPARILPAYGRAWPQPQIDVNTVQIRVTGGYPRLGSPDVSGTPEPIKQAILLVVGDLFERRVDTHVGTGQPTPMPRGVEALLYPYRMLGFV